MEGDQDGCGYSHIHWHHSERSSGAKTPKTPSVREGTPNYNDMYCSGRSSQEKTPSVRNGSGEKTPTSYDHRLLPPTSRSSGERTSFARDFEQHLPPNGCIRSVETSRGERSAHKREGSNEEKRMYEGDEEEESYNNQMDLVVPPGIGSEIVPRSRSPFQGSNKNHDCGRAASAPPGKNGLSKSPEFRSYGRRGKVYDDEVSTEEDSACFVFRGHWNSTPPGMKSELISTSQVSVVERFVQAEAKALGKCNDSKNFYHQDEWGPDYKKPKSPKNHTQQKAVAAVLAFQRWRHTQLKKLFSMELKNVLEEAKEDEACLATLEKELATKDKHLAQLRSQLAHYEKESHEQINQRQIHELLGANVEELEKECHKALERASMAEEVLRKRDAEVARLRDRLKSLDEEGVRLDSELQTNIKVLQKEKESAIDEGRILLAQLTRRDEEVTQQCKEIEKLRVKVAQLTERQRSQQNQADCMKADHQAQVENLQDKLQQAYAAKHEKETELASFTERCNGLGQERQNLLVQLHRAVERADLASRRAEELQMKLHCTSEERAKASEDIAGEMVDHLKRLTGHMKELETSVDRNGLICMQPGALQKKAGLAKISAKLAQAEVDTLNLISHTQDYEDNEGRPGPLQEVNGEENKRQVCFSLDRKNSVRRSRQDRSSSAITPLRDEGDACSNISSIDREIALTKFKNWTAWKWRWAASAARAQNLSKQLQNQGTTLKSNFVKESEGSIVHRGCAFRERAMGLATKLKISDFDDLRLPDEKEIGAFILKHKLLPLIMAAWRAFARMSSLERQASSRNASLNKIISALPWWIRRVGERRLLERSFFHWQLLSLRAYREKSQPNQKKKIVPYTNPVYQSRVRDRQVDPPQAQARPAISRAPTPVRDVEVQTATRVMSRDAEVNGKRRTPTPGGVAPLKVATPRFPQRAKLEAKTTVLCPTCDIRRKFSRGQQQPTNFEPTQDVDPKPGAVNNSTFTARALRALQGSLQQELKELQYLLSQEMEDMQQGKQIPVRAEEHGDDGSGAAVNRQALKSVFEVCNNLAQALMDVRSQLNSAENQVNGQRSRGSPPPPPTTPRTSQWGVGEKSRLVPRYAEAKGAWDGGRASPFSKEKQSASRPSSAGAMRALTPRYASPIGREKGARFSSPAWQPQEKSAPSSTREPWSRLGSPATTRQLREREARVHAPSTTRELRDFRARQERQRHAYESNYPKSGRQSPEDRDTDSDRGDGGREQQRYLRRGENRYPKSGRRSPQHRDSEREDGEREQQRHFRRGENVVRFSQDEATVMERDDRDYEDEPVCTTSLSKLPPSPDYTTVVQILNQENTKIGEVAIHTSSVAADRTCDRGGIADLCSSARDAIRLEEQSNKNTNQLETHQRQHQNQRQTQEDQRTPQQLTEGPTYKSSQPNYRPKSALKTPARGHSTPRERTHSQSVLKRHVNSNSRLDDYNFLSSLRRKQCIGLEYADLLRAEIHRLREGRLMIEDGKSGPLGDGGDATPSREVTPRPSFLANRPSWRPHYNNTASSRK